MEPVLVLRQEHQLSSLTHLLWGLLPGWVKDRTRGHVPSTPGPSPSKKASFRGAWRHHRCLLPSSAFLEKDHRIQRADGRMFC